MGKPLVDDVLWERVERLLPVVERRYRYAGLDDVHIAPGLDGYKLAS